MSKWALSQGCKDSSISANQLIQHINKLKNKRRDYFNGWRESLWQNSTSIYDKNSPKSRHRRNISSGQSLSRIWLCNSHGLQHARLPCPLPTPRACSNSCPSSRWCHPTISSSVIPFSSRLQSFPASGSFLTSQFFASGGQSIGTSASASVLPMNIQTDFF